MTLTTGDLNKIGTIIDEKLEVHTREILIEMDNKLQNIKSDIFDRIDPILKEVVTAREERPMIENRLEALENIHTKGSHSISQ